MLRLPNGEVWLEEGETIPLTCACGHVYQRDNPDDIAECPACGKLTRVSEMPTYSFVPFKGND